MKAAGPSRGVSPATRRLGARHIAQITEESVPCLLSDLRYALNPFSACSLPLTLLEQLYDAPQTPNRMVRGHPLHMFPPRRRFRHLDLGAYGMRL